MLFRANVNGEWREADVWPGSSLLSMLRDRLGLPGSKNACEQGECGSCSVWLDGELVCACLVLAAQAHDREVRTVEALLDGERLHPVQEAVVVVDGRGTVALPGLVNTHHHLYQTLTRVRAQDQGLFGWLTELYPVWAGVDAEWERAAAGVGLAELALSGCSTTTDHHYVFPSGADGLMEAEIEAAGDIGVRFHPCRGSMDLGASAGGLPPDSIVQDPDAILDHTQSLVHRFHDPTPGSMLRIAVAPCSPFTASERLMKD